MRILLFLLVATALLSSCKKQDLNYLSHDTGVWEIQSMTIDYINASGGTDSTTSSGITGFFMFYDTPTTGDDPFYLNTSGITIHGQETHSAHYWRISGSELTLENSIGSAPVRVYTISDRKRNEMTWDYSGPLNNMYAPYSGNVKEHITLKRVKS